MLHVTFDKEQETYFPGQEVAGVLNINLKEETRISSIIMCFSGVGILLKDGAHNKDVIKQEIYFDHVVCLLNSEGEENVKKHLEEGSHPFPFKYKLPEAIPASFESPNGCVRYSVTTHVEGPDIDVQSAVTYFTVNAILDLNNIPKCRQPCTDIAQQDVCLFCFKCGPVSAMLNIPQRGFVPGEHIFINAEINNLHNKPISYVKATLVQVIKYHYKSGPTKIKRAVAEVLRGSVMPYESQVWREEPLQIPPVAASKLAHCSLMDIWYNLYLHICSTGLEIGETLKLLKVPVVIGTVPLRLQAENLQMEAGEPLLTGSNLLAPTAEPCIFGPYSIKDPQEEGNVEISFSPLYVTYSARADILELHV
ncbi:arrestin domain-containing protein 17-like [Periplaneta americana]|uniref:arrestin domain-containing protein 17-like n=1 Tax=Periplaneta americana TaxID=6978 RepID=UPI0037E9BBD7